MINALNIFSSHAHEVTSVGKWQGVTLLDSCLYKIACSYFYLEFVLWSGSVKKLGASTRLSSDHALPSAVARKPRGSGGNLGCLPVVLAHFPTL